jgi:hypothetical protein
MNSRLISSRRALFPSVLILSLLLALAACSGNQTNNALPESESSQIDLEGVFEPMNPEAMTRFQPDVRMGAVWKDGWVIITIRNRTPRELPVNYTNFGVNYKGRLYRANPADVNAQFPRTILKPGEMASGRLLWRELGNLTGCYFVFHHSNARASQAKVRSFESLKPTVESAAPIIHDMTAPKATPAAPAPRRR